MVSVRRKKDKVQVLVRGTGCEKNDKLCVDTEFRGDIPPGSSIRRPGEEGEIDIGRVGYAH